MLTRNISLAENRAPGFVAVLFTADPQLQAINATLVGDNNTSFSLHRIGDVSFELHVAVTFDFEALTEQCVAVRLIDNDAVSPMYRDVTYCVHVVDVDEAPLNISLSSLKAEENSAPGTVFANFSALNDAGQTLFYHLIDTASGRFALDGCKLVAGTNNINFESTVWLVVTVNVTDDGSLGLWTVATFNITVVNMNDPPIISLTDCGDCRSAVLSRDSGSRLGLLRVLDDDLQQNHTIWIKDVVNDGSFDVVVGFWNSTSFPGTAVHPVNDTQFVANATFFYIWLPLQMNTTSLNFTLAVLDDGEPAQLTYTRFTFFMLQPSSSVGTTGLSRAQVIGLSISVSFLFMLLVIALVKLVLARPRRIAPENSIAREEDISVQKHIEALALNDNASAPNVVSAGAPENSIAREEEISAAFGPANELLAGLRKTLAGQEKIFYEERIRSAIASLTVVEEQC